MQPDWGMDAQPKFVPWPGMEPVTFPFAWTVPSELSHTHQGVILVLIPVP